MKKSASFALLMIALGTTALIPVKAQDGLVYVAVDPCRLADTRDTTAIPAFISRNFLVYGADLSSQGGDAGGCAHPREGSGVEPLAISAYVVGVPTATSGAGHLTAYASDGTVPGNATATVNYAAGQVNGNTTNVTLCQPGPTCPTDGQMAIKVFTTEQNVVIDVQGYFYPQEVAASSALHVVDGTGNTIGPMVEWDENVLLLTDTGYFTRVLVIDDIGGVIGPEKAGTFSLLHQGMSYQGA